MDRHTIQVSLICIMLLPFSGYVLSSLCICIVFSRNRSVRTVRTYAFASCDGLLAQNKESFM